MTLALVEVGKNTNNAVANKVKQLIILMCRNIFL